MSLLLQATRQPHPGAMAELRAELGLDLPLPQQFLHYIKETLHGNLGYSYDHRRSRRTIARRRLADGAAHRPLDDRIDRDRHLDRDPAGMAARSGFDQGMLGVTLVLYSMPEFWFGLLMIMLFAVTSSIFPTGGMETPESRLHGRAARADVLNHMALPFFVLTVAYLAEYSIIMRSSLLETLGEDFIPTARSKGMWRSGFCTARGAERAAADDDRHDPLAGIRSWGRHHDRDHLQLAGSRPPDVHRDHEPGLLDAQGLFLLFSAAVIFANLVADLLYSYLDPRVRAA